MTLTDQQIENLEVQVRMLREALSEAHAENHVLETKINRLRTEAELREVEINNLKAELHDKGLLE